MRCDREHDDGAYVIGALSPAERATYERHLNTCAFCRQAVADLAVIPGLLGRLDPADVARLLEPDPPKVVSRNRLPELVTAVQVSKSRDHRRGRRRTMGTALVAVAATLVVGAAGALAWPNDGRQPGGGAGTAAAAVTFAATAPAPATVSMYPIGGASPLSARLHLATAPWGTLITMTCVYAKTATPAKPYSFRLIAYGPDDAREQIGSFTAGPGAELRIPGTTRFSGSALSRVELVRYDNTALLAYDVP